MRILVITPYFYPHFGGSQHYIEEIYSALMDDNPNVEVDVICYNTEKTKKEEKYRNLNIYRVDAIEILRGQFALANYLEIISLIKKLNQKHTYQVVNSHSRFFDCSWWTPYIAKYLGAKSVLTDHCAYHPTHKSWFISKIAKAVDKLLSPIISKKYDHITVVSKATQKFFKKLTGLNSKIIYPGSSNRNIKKINTDNKKLLISFVGRMIDSKKPHLVALAAQNITKQYPNTTFVFAGDGPLLPQLQQSNNPQIKFLGKLSHEKTQKLLEKTDILVHPSQHHEGLPLTLLEAGVANCAIAATDQGGTKEIIKDKQTGLIIDSPPTVKNIETTLKKLIDDSVLRKNLSKNLKKQIKNNYQWSKSARQLIELF